MKPIDWPRILADPNAFAGSLYKLDERISHWPALCELCNVDPYRMAAFDVRLMILVRDFFLVVRAREWDTAEVMYDEITATRERIAKQLGVQLTIKPQPVG